MLVKVNKENESERERKELHNVTFRSDNTQAFSRCTQNCFATFLHPDEPETSLQCLFFLYKI